MGNKWLRSGGATPASNNDKREEDKLRSVNVAIEISDGENSGAVTTDKSLGGSISIPDKLGVSGGKQDINQNNSLVSPNSIIMTNNNKDINEIIVTDPKRRRVAQDNKSPAEDLNNNPQEQDMVDSTTVEQQNQKNLYLAGTALQSRHSS